MIVELPIGSLLTPRQQTPYRQLQDSASERSLISDTLELQEFVLATTAPSGSPRLYGPRA
jgi:hypothetical protein